jgi:DNA-directed RNA polymerase subunit K
MNAETSSRIEEFSKYEIARILGARGLQIAMNAPLLIKISDEELEEIKFDPLLIAEKEFNSGILPISVRRPFPEKFDKDLKKVATKRLTDQEKVKLESQTEEEIKEEGEIMELATPDDEVEETGDDKNEELE